MGEMNASVEKRTFGRRSFIKGSAATLGLAAVAGAGCTAKDELEEKDQTQETEWLEDTDQYFAGVCRGNCFGGCALKIRVREGKIVGTTAQHMPDEQYSRICQRGHSHLQHIYSPDRLKVPLRRVGERGSGQWEEITWDEAIDEIVTKWNQYIEEDGPTAVATSPGSGNFGVTATYYPGRLRFGMGLATINSCYDNCYFHAGVHAEGLSQGYNSNEIADIQNSKYIVIWGSNPAVAQPQNMGFIMNAKEAGAKIVVVDPNYTVTAGKADWWIPLRPTTDGVLILAMMNYIIEQGLTDEAFIRKSTVGPFLVKADTGTYLRQSDITGAAPEEGAVDPIILTDGAGNFGTAEEIAEPAIEGTFEANGISVTCAYTLLKDRVAQYSVDYAAEMCDMSADDIRKFAQEYATMGPSTIYQGFGPDHYANGERAYFNMIAMAGITGNIAKPGASCGYDWNYTGYVKGIVAPASTFPAPLGPGQTLIGPGLYDSMVSGQQAGAPVKLRSLYFYTHNPIANQTERMAWLKVFDMLDFVVTVDFRMTDTARYSDLVLPVAHWFEYDEIMPMTSPYLLWQDKAIDPLYESKTDLDIINLIGSAMGRPEDFSMSREEFLRAATTNDAAAANGVTYDKLVQEKFIDIMDGDPYFIHAGSGVFPTSTGKLNFYLEAPAPYVAVGQEFDVAATRLPYWFPPNEAWPETVGGIEANPLAAQYPLIFTTERNRFKCHTQFGHNPWMLELAPEPIIRINPDDAAARGIADGDYVRVFNDRGDCQFKASLQPGIRPGMLVAPKGWEEDQFRSGHYSNLTNHYFNPYTPNNCYFDTLVQIEKA